MTVVTVVKKTVAVTGIILPENVEIVTGAQMPIKPFIKPFNATNNTIYWSSASPLTANIDDYGIVTAVAPGSIFIYAATEDGGFVDSTKITIVPSAKPEIATNLRFGIQQGIDSIYFSLDQYIIDDNTSFENLRLTIMPSAFDTRIMEKTFIAKQTSNTTLGENPIYIGVTDRDGMSDTLKIFVTVSVETNTSPTILTIPNRTIKKGTDFMPMDLNKFVTDDYTIPEKIQWKIIQGINVYVRVSEQTAQIIILNPEFIGTDSVQFIAIDKEGLADTASVLFTISEETNLAPFILDIPYQIQTEDHAFSTIELSNYIMDDYTLAENMLWEIRPSDKVSLNLTGTKLSASVMDKSWIGSEIVTIIAIDESGASSQANITYTQKIPINTEDWSGKPQVDFYADRTIVAVGSSAQFHASISGMADLGWTWQFEGGHPSESFNLDEAVTYNTPGTYNAMFKAQNANGTDSLLREDYISVFGIIDAPDTVCAFTSITLTVSDKTLDAYEWSTGENSSNISISPSSTNTYSVTATLGLFKFIDSVTIVVPNMLDLGPDTALCQQDKLKLDFTGYKAVNWDGMGMQTMQKIFFADEARKYIAEATDSFGCASIDTVAITELLPLPTVELGENIAICSGTSYSIDAGTNARQSYIWSTGSSENSIDVAESGTYRVTVTDVKTCISVDSITISVLEPYSEPLGLVTNSQTDDAILIVWERTSGKRTKEYKVLRETGIVDSFDTLATVPFNNNSVYIDKEANEKQQAYKYKLLTIDSCGNTAESKPHVTMHLQMNKNLDNSIDLKWTPYVPEDLYKSYVIYRSKPNSNDMDSIASIASTTGSSWTEIENIQHEATYRVAVRFDNSIYTNRLKSDSGPYSQSISNLSEAVVTSTADDATRNKTIIVYPTPADESITILSENLIGSLISLSLVDNTGKVVLAQLCKNSRNYFAQTLDISELASGTYTLRLEDNSQCILKTVVIK